MTSRLTSLLLSAGVLLTSLAAAEPPPDEQLHDRARTFLVLRLTDALDLSDEKALEASRILKRADERRRKLQQERHEAGKEIRRALDAPQLDRERLAALVDRAGKLDQEIALVPARSFEELRAILTVEQQAKLVLARPKIHDEIRGAMRRRIMQMRPRPSEGDERSAGGRPSEPRPERMRRPQGER
ncbi:MAG: Spy/CpxP family protein refolding chaperone [Candidatus Binatia bacterium]